MDSVSELLDRSVGAKEYIIGTGGDADPLIDLNQLDFEQLIGRFGGRKRTAAKAIERDIEARLDEAVRKTLDYELPDVYGPELFDRKVDAIFDHIYTSYHNNGESVYS